MNKRHYFRYPVMLTLLILALLLPTLHCFAEGGEVFEFDFENIDYEYEIILDDPIYFMADNDEDCLCDVEETPTPTPDPTEEPMPQETESPALTPRPPKKEPLLYDIPKEVLAADDKFATLIEEATKYIGYPYVYGGHCPATSFDCSGFVSYVFTNSGVYKTGGRGATGLYSICEKINPEEARPGDLIFFQGTMGKDVAGVTHVGIYVGNNMMLHCGNPIGYANISESFWQEHFYAYGRLPY